MCSFLCVTVTIGVLFIKRLLKLLNSEVRFIMNTFVYTTVQKSGVSKLLFFFKDVFYAHQGCIYLTKKSVIL